MSAKATDRIVTLADLEAIPAPLSLGPRHRPVPHATIVRELEAELGRRNLVPSATTLSLSGGEDGTARLDGRFEFIDLTKKDRQREALVASRAATYTGINKAAVQALLPAELRGDHGVAITFGHANDKTRSLRLSAAQLVFVCNNLAVSFEVVGGARRRHTGDQPWDERIPDMIEQTLGSFERFNRLLENLRNAELTDGRAKELIYDVVTNVDILPASSFAEVGRTYFEHATPDVGGRTRWDLHNAFTRFLGREKMPERRRQEGSSAVTRWLGSDILPLEVTQPNPN